MAVHLHLAERTDGLADGLASLLARPLEDPFARELVVVPARGVERWLTQRLSHRLGVGARSGDGVCAGVQFVSPRSLVSLLLDADHEGAGDPWDPDTVAWPLMGVIDAAMGEPGFEDLTRHLGGGDPDHPWSSRRYAVARRLAGLFASYAAQRPSLITDWREGRDTDGTGNPLPADLAWQPEVWRRLLARLGTTPPDERHRETLARLRGGGADLDLPPRLSFFGHTRLPRTEVELLGALGSAREVHLWLPQVSPAVWTALAPTAVGGPVSRIEDDSAEWVGHPLLASLGRDARELRRTLGVIDAEEEVLVSPPRPEASTLLGWLQADLRENSLDTARAAQRTVDPTDRSVQVHACHGAARQVDVLREVLVGLLEDDPTLEPRDIVVMCPDIEAYAPLISAAFGLADLAPEGAHPAHELRVRLADRATGATNPLLALAASLVELAGGRLTATQVLDLAAAEPVRRRFGFDDDALERIHSWVRDSAVRWGWDAEHRGDFGLDLPDNTWSAGLRRLLLGAAVSGSGHRVVAGSLPVDDVGDGALEALGAFAEFLARLEATLDTARRATTVADWMRALSHGVHQLTRTPPDEAWRLAQFDREVARIGAGVAETSADDVALRHADVRALLAHRLRGRPTRSNFRTGTLTVCTMVPMRSVPHRVVALLGLDDGVFPRLGSIDGDDVLGRRPLTGERDVRAEDRQLLLDAVAAAGDHLVITYTGRGVHTGAERPPAVPLGELLDALDVSAAPTGFDRVRDQVVVRHPLQPFDEANLVMPSELARRDHAFTFDRAALAGAVAARGERTQSGPLVPAPLAVAEDGAEVSLADLHEFFAHPVRAFAKRRLRISTPLDLDEVSDGIPIELDGLARWDVGDRLIRSVLAHDDPQAAMLAEQLRGLLPPRDLGVGVLEGIVGQVRPLVMAGQDLRQGPARVVDVDVDLGDRRVTGTIDDLFGTDLVMVGFSTLAAKHRIAGWIDALALAAGLPGQPWTVHTLGRGRGGGQRARIDVLPPDDARRLLRDLLDVRERGLREPLPLPLKTASAWAAEHVRERDGRRSADADAAALHEWRTDPWAQRPFPTEDADVWHRRVWGDHAPLSVLCADPRPDEDWGDQRHRLGLYAWRVWGPLLAHEVVSSL